MSDLKLYDVVVNGTATTLQLSDDDARARGLLGREQSPPEPRRPASKARTVANKARGAANKGA